MKSKNDDNLINIIYWNVLNPILVTLMDLVENNR